MGSGGALIFKPAKWQDWLEILPFETRLTIALPRNYLPIAFHSDALNVEKEKIQLDDLLERESESSKLLEYNLEQQQINKEELASLNAKSNNYSHMQLREQWRDIQPFL